MFKVKKLSAIILLASLAFLSNSCSTMKSTEDNKQDPTNIQEGIPSEINENGTYKTLENSEDAARYNTDSERVAMRNNATENEIEVQDRVFFDYDSFTISEQSAKIIDVQAMWLNSDKSIEITVEGHCDERGTREYNIALGEKRANSVKNYLVNKGVDADRIKTVSYGKERPAYFGTSEEVMSKNRRAVITINN